MNKRAKVFLLLALLAGLGVAVLQACNLQDLVHLDIPKPVLHAISIPDDERLTVSDADRVWSMWSEWVAQNSYLLTTEIENGQERYEVLASMASTGLEVVSAQAATVPGGGLLIGALGALGGLFIKDPRSRKREIEAYKQGLHNAGVSAK